MKIKLLFAILLIAFLTSPGFAQNKAEKELPSFSEDKIEEYKNQRDFQYNTDVPLAHNAWGIFRTRLFNLIKRFFSNDGAMPIIRYMVLAIAILFILYRVFGMQANSLFGKKQSSINTNDFIGEVTDITTVNFEDEANAAFDNQELRLAVRFLFLHSLQLLETKQLIIWHIEKTNASYLRELKGEKLFPAFREIVRAYDFVWYGHFEIDENQFQDFQEKIAEFKMSVPQKTSV